MPIMKIFRIMLLLFLAGVAWYAISEIIYRYSNDKTSTMEFGYSVTKTNDSRLAAEKIYSKTGNLSGISAAERENLPKDDREMSFLATSTGVIIILNRESNSIFSLSPIIEHDKIMWSCNSNLGDKQPKSCIEK